MQRQDTEGEQGDSKSFLLETKTVSQRGPEANWVLCLSLSDGLTSAKGIWDEANRGRERNERERPGAPRTHQATGSSQAAHCRLQGQSRRAPVGSLWASGPQVTHQQRCAAVEPHPWGVRGLAQARLQDVGVWNPGWVPSWLWSLPGTHTHMWGYTHRYTQRQVPCADLFVPLPQSTNRDWGPDWGSSTSATVSQPRDPCCPYEETSAPPLPPTTS